MVTPFHVGTNRPTKRLNLHVSSVSPLPKSYRDAFNDPNWENVMRDEYTAFIKYKTWTLVPRPPDTNIVRCMWLFCHRKFALEILDMENMANCNPNRTPIDAESKLGSDGDPITNPNLYRSLAGYGLQLFSSSTTDLVAYSDADWAGCPTTRLQRHSIVMLPMLLQRLTGYAIYWMVVKDIEDVLLEEIEKFGWWFEQDIDGEKEDDNAKKVVMINEEGWMS
ncbi:ribonuclease H-like domain-containing protein [Tanacetum coccineum]